MMRCCPISMQAAINEKETTRRTSSPSSSFSCSCLGWCSWARLRATQGSTRGHAGRRCHACMHNKWARCCPLASDSFSSLTPLPAFPTPTTTTNTLPARCPVSVKGGERPRCCGKGGREAVWQRVRVVSTNRPPASFHSIPRHPPTPTHRRHATNASPPSPPLPSPQAPCPGVAVAKNCALHSSLHPPTHPTIHSMAHWHPTHPPTPTHSNTAHSHAEKPPRQESLVDENGQQRAGGQGGDDCEAAGGTG